MRYRKLRITSNASRNSGSRFRLFSLVPNSCSGSSSAVLVEGYMDVIGVYSAGIKEVVASCGTALTNTQVRALKRHSDRTTLARFKIRCQWTDAWRSWRN